MRRFAAPARKPRVPATAPAPRRAVIGALLLGLGLVLLVGGGHLLVQGAGTLAASLRIPPVVIGLTIVAFGTSAPELVVSVLGATSGNAGVAFGNVLGSNLANLGLVLGASALVLPLTVEGQIVRREIPLLLMAGATALVMVLDEPLRGTPALLDRPEGLCLLLLFAVFLYVNVSDVITGRPEDPVIADLADYAGPRPGKHRLLNGGLVLLGLAGLTLGGDLTVDAAVTTAQGLGVPQVLIGLSVVAVGTSLPELVTSVIAALRREADLALGNLVGSCVFNLLFVLPVAAVVAPIPVPGGGTFDTGVSLLLTALLLPLCVTNRFQLLRRDGLILLVAYLAYLGSRATLAS